jgi:anti-anti-sigma factor
METRQLHDMLVLYPRHDIVASRLDEFRREVQAVIDAGHMRLAIDLDGVSIIDSKGLAMLMMCYKSVTARGGALTVVTPNDDFKHLFHLMRLDEHFTVVDTLQPVDVH